MTTNAPPPDSQFVDFCLTNEWRAERKIGRDDRLIDLNKRKKEEYFAKKNQGKEKQPRAKKAKQGYEKLV
ncbi:hypothetical protein [Nitrospira sp.]|uniref:hypothetical protein n=1 Tax=Nitrospira sp. TaxID=70125 RepID=UPI003FCCBAC4